MKTLILLILFISIGTSAHSQRALRALMIGDEYFRTEQYTLALEAYQSILRTTQPLDVQREVSFRIGQTHQQLLNYSEARKWFTVALQAGYPDPIIYRNLSEMSLGMEDFDMAIEYALQYVEKVPEDPFGKKFLESARFSKEHYHLETLFEIENLTALNTPGQEWGISYFGANRLLYASTFQPTGPQDTRTGTGFSSIYQVAYDSITGSIGQPVRIKGDINTIFYEGFMTFDPTRQLGYFMNCGGPEGTRETCAIYTARYNPETDTWGTPVLFHLNSREYNFGYPSVSADGQVLYFASDIPGGFGGYDLYKTIWNPTTRQWGGNINLGPIVNTSLNEAYPFIAGDILYFSSFGLPGFGGFDVFYSQILEDGTLSPPINMGAPINSSADDFGFIINTTYTSGFLSSNRPGGLGKDDLYSFRFVANKFDLKGIVRDQRTGLPIGGAQITIHDENNRFFRVVTDPTGAYFIPQLESDVNYMVEAEKSGFEPFFQTLSVKDKLIASRFLAIPEFRLDIELATRALPPPQAVAAQPRPEQIPTRPDITGITQGLPTIHFEFARYSLTPFAQQQLDSVIAFLRLYPNAGLIVHAHTDVIAGYLFNFYLSQNRAQSVINYLVSRGIPEDRIYPLGHGKMDMIFPNARTPEEHRRNRRATFEIINAPRFEQFLDQAPRLSFRYLNSLHKEVHQARGIEFMIQFAATRLPVNPQYYERIINRFPNYDIIYYYGRDRLHRYSVGAFTNLEKANTVVGQLRELGFQAFVVAFRNGNRISITEAIQQP